MNYWQIAAMAARQEAAHARFEARRVELEAAKAAVAQALSANGLDPAKNYTLNDADESVTEQPNASP